MKNLLSFNQRRPFEPVAAHVSPSPPFGMGERAGVRWCPDLIRTRHQITVSSGPRFVAALLAGIFLTIAAQAQNPNSIIFTKHNLSVSGPGPVRAAAETEICVFCHTPHSATIDGPLWNHGLSSANYTTFTITKGGLNQVVGQPSGASRLCLSCHDGTVAPGLVNTRGNIPMASSTLSAADNLGTDLSADHPVSFVYDNNLATTVGDLVDPSTLAGPVRLDRNGELQCTACHDPHNNQYGSFLVMDNTGSTLCLQCHSSTSGLNSPHTISGKALPSALASQIALPPAAGRQSRVAVKKTTVAAAGCSCCHVSHAAGNQQALMRFAAPEKNCLSCHDSQGPGQNLAAEFNKVSVHPIFQSPEAHRPHEDQVNPPVRHVTCADCHNSHAVNNSPGSSTRVAGALAAVTGVGAGGSVIHTIAHEYELCFRCHGDSASRGPAKVTRQFVETNTRREFNPGNVSFHPVESIGKNPLLPSLIPPLTAASTMNCTDCHNNDQGSANGGPGPKGPHGSAFEPLLERQLLVSDLTPYNPANFALCYKCHSSAVVDSRLNTSWQYHQQHIETVRAACTTCHDSHAANQPHLINFNTTYVQPNGVLTYTSTGPNHGTCTLTCHDGTGKRITHAAKSY